jgi:hypothetical protein
VIYYIYTDIELKFRGSNGLTRQVVVPLQTHTVKSLPLTPQSTSDVGMPHPALGRQEGAATVVEPQRTGVSRMQARRPVCSVAQEAAVDDDGAERWRFLAAARRL